MATGLPQTVGQLPQQNNEERLQQEYKRDNKDLQTINAQVSQETKRDDASGPAKQPANRITRKLEGGRPHKVYDYMFIQMSNEQFKSEYEQKKIFTNKTNQE